jgi:PTS system nitrogen regulatory IIA component
MEEIMTLEEVAKYLKMQPQTIYTWAQTGKIPAAKIGKEWRFRKDIIEEWFKQHIDDKFKSLINEVERKKNTEKIININRKSVKGL